MRPVGADAEAAYLDLVARRESGEPVAYMRGIKEFHGIALTVDPRALIPRPETELLVDLALAEIMRRADERCRPRPRRCTVVDVGTGSGAVADRARGRRCGRGACPPTTSRSRPSTSRPTRSTSPGRTPSVTPSATGSRFENADLLPPTARSRPFDIVLANLPYVRTSEIDELPGSGRARRSSRASPSTAAPTAWRSSPGCSTSCRGALADGGVALLEIGADQGDGHRDSVRGAAAGLGVRRRARPGRAGPRVAVLRRATA